jgi:hypothetical protein
VEGFDAKTKTSIMRKDKWSMYYDYEKIVGGSFVKLGKNNTDITLKADKLRSFVGECKDILGQPTLTDDDKAKVLMAEILVLSIYQLRKNDEHKTVNLYEQWDSIPSDPAMVQVVISTGAFLFNITRYDQSICRYDNEFYEAISNSTSYESFKDRITNGEEEKNDLGYIHRVSLRNFEVLQDIIVKFEGAESVSGFEQFFTELDKLAKYAFPLYEYKAEDKENYNKIHLTFLRPIMDAIRSMRENQEFINNLFGNSNPQENQREDVTGDNTSHVSGSVTTSAPASTETSE